MRESAESRSAAVRAVLLRFYPHQYAWGKSRALTVSLLLGFTEAAHDSALRNRISKRTVVCGLREWPARASCACTSIDFHSMHLTVQTYILLFSSGLARRRARLPASPLLDLPSFLTRPIPGANSMCPGWLLVPRATLSRVSD